MAAVRFEGIWRRVCIAPITGWEVRAVGEPVISPIPLAKIISATSKPVTVPGEDDYGVGGVFAPGSVTACKSLVNYFIVNKVTREVYVLCAHGIRIVAPFILFCLAVCFKNNTLAVPIAWVVGLRLPLDNKPLPVVIVATDRVRALKKR